VSPRPNLVAVQVPANLRFSVDHLWVLVVGESARIGVTDRFGGPVHGVTLPAVGEPIRRGEPLGWAYHDGAKRALVAPISGTVVLVNESLKSNSDHMLTDPFGAGWLIECQLSYDETLEDVMDAGAYHALP
jgi:glycine cleavage system H protein